MNLLIATFVFFLTIGLSIQSVAEENHGADELATVCKAGSTPACDPKPVHAPAGHGGGHGNISEKMNSLFPEKQADLAKSTRPTKAEPTSPKFLATVAAGAVNLEWQATEGATNYHVQVATDPQFKWLVANDHFVKTTNFNFAQAEAGKRYFWRVASVKDQNESAFTKSNFVSSAFNVK